MYKDLDLKIISYLQKNGRASFREVASGLGVSTTTVSNRVKELEENGIIKHFKPVMDYRKLGFQLTAVTMIKAKGNEIIDIAQKLKGDNYLTHVYEITGEFDILAIGKFRDQKSMNKEIKKLLNNPAIEETNTSVVLQEVKEDSEIKLIKES